jgi:hypothetical protein
MKYLISTANIHAVFLIRIPMDGSLIILALRTRDPEPVAMKLTESEFLFSPNQIPNWTWPDPQ